MEKRWKPLVRWIDRICADPSWDLASASVPPQFLPAARRGEPGAHWQHVLDVRPGRFFAAAG